MALVNLITNLKSLKFSKDRFGGGNSGQPFIKTPIDDDPSGQSADKDFLLRGGLRAPLRAGIDTARLTQYFFNLKSPSGFLFIAKQNLLSRISPATEASGNQLTNNSWTNTPLNEGIYTPLSTLAQSLGGFAGLHAFKQGLNPLEGIRTYSDIVTPGELGTSIKDISKNRLVDLYSTKVLIKSSNTNIFSYSGGPGSFLGIGRTNIKFADQRTGINLGKDFNTYQVGLKNSNTDRADLPFYNPLQNFPSSIVTGVSTRYYDDIPLPSVTIGGELPIFNGFITNGDGSLGRDFTTNVYLNNSIAFNSPRINDNNASTWDQNDLARQTNLNNSTNVADPSIQDFRAPLLDGKTKSTIMSGYNSYTDPKKTYEGKNGSRVGITSPGLKGNKRSYTLGKRDENGNSLGSVDKINAQPIYESKNVKGRNEINKNDLVKFRIAAIDKSNPNLKQYMHFRAFIDNFSDAYSAEWGSQKYMGRGEPLYKYGGFGRTISMDFTVAAQSKLELIEQYKKLNFLASNLAPTYSDAGYMGGPLVTLTMGGWCYELPGFLTSLSLGIPQESPWEIGINDSGGSDSSVKELPHIVKVSGLSFTPIHTFRPEKQINTYGGDNDTISTYGKQRYLALKAVNNNYDS